MKEIIIHYTILLIVANLMGGLILVSTGCWNSHVFILSALIVSCVVYSLVALVYIFLKLTKQY